MRINAITTRQQIKLSTQKHLLIVTSRACGWAIAGLLDHGYFPGMVGMNDALEPENLISTQMNI
jgi:hypothetical protein